MDVKSHPWWDSLAACLQGFSREGQAGVQAECTRHTSSPQAFRRAAFEKAQVLLDPHQCFVQRPPQFLQNLREVLGGWFGDRHAAREGAIEVRMSANVTRHDVFAFSIELFSLWVSCHNLSMRANVGYLISDYVHRLIFGYTVRVFPGD